MPGAEATEEGVMLKWFGFFGGGNEAGSVSVGKVGKLETPAAVGEPFS